MLKLLLQMISSRVKGNQSIEKAYLSRILNRSSILTMNTLLTSPFAYISSKVVISSKGLGSFVKEILMACVGMS